MSAEDRWGLAEKGRDSFLGYSESIENYLLTQKEGGEA